MGSDNEYLQNVPIGIITSDFTKFSEGNYSGREISVHRPTWDPEGVLVRYKLSGRSDGSKAREMFGSLESTIPDAYDNAIKKTVSIDFRDYEYSPNIFVKTSPLNESDDYTKAYQIYTALQVMNGGECILASNGHQTDSLIERVKKSSDFFENMDGHLKAVLNAWGPETDGPNKTPQTSRVAGIVNKKDEEFNYVLGSIDRYHKIVFQSAPLKSLDEGSSAIVSTYRHDTPWMDIPAEVRIVDEQGSKSFVDEINDSWKEAKKESVILRETKEEISVATSMAWVYVDKDGQTEIEIRDAFKD
ncbi:MAG: hypothetical protein GOV02_01140 [Candidatus Aenigmarchaeota archaeon]|nr:hypothetical protein [Candidatus Aenigmarchaeota archaeon]